MRDWMSSLSYCSHTYCTHIHTCMHMHIYGYSAMRTHIQAYKCLNTIMHSTHKNTARHARVQATMHAHFTTAVIEYLQPFLLWGKLYGCWAIPTREVQGGCWNTAKLSPADNGPKSVPCPQSVSQFHWERGSVSLKHQVALGVGWHSV